MNKDSYIVMALQNKSRYFYKYVYKKVFCAFSLVVAYLYLLKLRVHCRLWNFLEVDGVEFFSIYTF